MKQLKEMAQLAIFSNRISEIHEKNMRMWPLVMFNGVLGVQIEWDLELKNESYVSYRLNMSNKADNPHLENRFLALENAIRGIFWKEVKLVLYFNDIKMYNSEKENK
jgi:hypothetical protein